MTKPQSEFEDKMYAIFEKMDITPLADISKILYEIASPHFEINMPSGMGKWVFINPMNKQWYSQEEYDEAIREAREEGAKAGFQEGRERALSMVIHELDIAEQDKEMADDPHDPKIRVKYLKNKVLRFIE